MLTKRQRTFVPALILIALAIILPPLFAQDSTPEPLLQQIETVTPKTEAIDSTKTDNLETNAKNSITKTSKDGKELSAHELMQRELKKKKKPKTKSDIIKGMIYNVLGGLGIFLLGMKFMSEGIQTVAGPSLKKLIKAITDNRFMACGVGVLVTMLVQSSSVTTVMAVGFVNSTIMELNQAIGVILGANIGTTVTGWILVLKIGKLGLPMIGIAAFVYLFSKKEIFKYIAYAIIGIGMVFFGLELMKNGFKPMQGFEEFSIWFKKFDASTYAGVLSCAMVGCILTVIVQSSSATLGITIALTAVGVIEFETAAALVLGENIGTTITAFLASLNSNSNAKKAAYFHVAFNIFGVIWITAIFPYYIELIRSVMINFHNITDLNSLVADSEGDMIRGHTKVAIAYVHTIFNVTNVLLFLPFTGIAAKLLNKYVPDKTAKTKAKDGEYLTQLNFQMHDSAFAAIEQSSFEVHKMRDKTREMFDDLEKFLTKKKKDKFAARIFTREDTLDTVQAEITKFLTEVLSGTLSLEQTEQAKKQLLLADEYESVSDYVMQVLKYYMRLDEHGLSLSEDQKSEIASIHVMLLSFFDKVHASQEDLEVLHTEAMQLNSEVTLAIKALRNKHLDRIATEKMPPLLSTSYNDIINGYRKIKNILVHVLETRSGSSAEK